MKLSALLIFLLLVIRSAIASTADRPNILWITSEDNSISWISCYGSKNAETPNIDQLAKEGFRYTHCFDNAAVCAPTRSTWITGHYAISIGTQPMRSRYAIPHDKIPYYPDQLKAAGYFVGNGGKTDYNIGSREDKETWTDGGSWEKRPDGSRFFTIKNIGDSHESRAFPKGNPPQHDPAKMMLHAYHPDLPEVRQTYARYADAVENMDTKVGEVIASLKEDGLYEDTIIIYCSDHGGVIARSKRFLYSSGTHCPLIVRIPEKWKAWWPATKPGMTVDRIVSFVDMPKTWLSLAGAEIPEGYQGTIFLGPDTEPAPAYHLGFRERADEACDMVRGMRDERFAYIKNYMPWAPNGQKLQYMYTMEATRAWYHHHQEGKTDSITGRFFRPRVSEEFYDTVEDFDNVHNLIDDPAHAKKIDELKKALRKRQLELFDSGLLPEAMRVRRAEESRMTIYEMVRNPKLYPLERYLDLSDLALERNPAHREKFVEALSDPDEGIRYWGACGLFLLKDEATPAIQAIQTALGDEAGEVQMMAAWTMDNLGHKELADATLESLKKHPRSDSRLYECLLRWMGREVYDPEAMPEKKSRPQKKPIAGLIKDWMIIGPFEDKSSDQLEAFAPAFSEEVNWIPIEKGFEPDRIDIQATIGEHDDCSAFVRTTVISPVDQTVTLRLQADDQARAVLNGKMVEGEKISLREGENDLILKVIDHKKGWRFTCAILRDGKPVEGLKFEARADKEFTSIFNGKDLTGWDGKPGAWEVRDGEIWCTGASKEKNWLIYRGNEPADFVLKLEFLWEVGNSGVQVRSDQIEGDWQIFGYQVEVAQQNKMGLWHHSLLDGEHPKKKARHLMTTAGEHALISEDGARVNTKVAEAESVQAHYKENEWNTLEIEARGSVLIQRINGVEFSTLTDNDSELSRKKGLIALQDHGKGCKVAFRKIELKTLSSR